jgi:hypothetical protein
VFNLDGADLNQEVFDGSRPIQVTMGANPMSFGELGQLDTFASLLDHLDTSQLPCTNTFPAPRDAGVPLQPFQCASAAPGGLDDMQGYSMDSFVDMQALQADGVFVQTPECENRTPYLPPAGARSSSMRRVGADWRHVMVSSEPAGYN